MNVFSLSLSLSLSPLLCSLIYLLCPSFHRELRRLVILIAPWRPESLLSRDGARVLTRVNDVTTMLSRPRKLPTAFPSVQQFRHAFRNSHFSFPRWKRTSVHYYTFVPKSGKLNKTGWPLKDWTILKRNFTNTCFLNFLLFHLKI